MLLKAVVKAPNEITVDDLRDYLKTLEGYSASYYENGLMSLKVFFRDFLKMPEVVETFKFPHQVLRQNRF